ALREALKQAFERSDPATWEAVARTSPPGPSGPGGTNPTPPGTGPTPSTTPLPAEVQDLIREASDLYNQASAAQADGDTVKWAQLLEDAQDRVRRADELLNPTTTTTTTVPTDPATTSTTATTAAVP